MSQPIWQRLMSLIELDQKFQKINNEIEDCNKQIQLQKQHKEKLSQILSSYELEINDAKKNVRNIEKDIDVTRLEIDSKKKALDLIQNQKEYRALKKEFDTLEEQHQTQEGKLLQNWHTLESLEKKFNQEKLVNKDNLESIDKDIEKINEQILELSKKAAECQIEHDKALANIPPEWRGRYEHMKGKIKDPIVPLLDNSCSVCYYQVLASDLARIKKGEILPCHNCYRLLYFNKEEEKSVQSESY